MRWIAFVLCVSPLAAYASTSQLNVSVAEGSEEPVSFQYRIDGSKGELDLRHSHNFDAAFKDPLSRKEICRPGEYKTGLLLTLRSLPKTENGSQPVEVIGQVSTLNSVKTGETLGCGTNHEVNLSTKAFSDTVMVEENRTKVVVIDNKYTVIVKVQ